MNQPPRVAVVDGVRTPFVKEGTAFAELDALELGKRCVAELVQRNDLDPERIDEVIFGRVIASMREHDIAREIVLGAGLPPAIEAFSVAQACITSYRTAVNGALAIQTGGARCVITGGADSASATPLALSDRLAKTIKKEHRAEGVIEHIRSLEGVGIGDLLPRPPRLEELSTGLSLGQSAEKMARLNGISREMQDDFAHRSHVRAAAAWADGRFDTQVMTVYQPGGDGPPIARDNLVRFDSDREKYRRLKPAFDRDYGTITAGNASPLTDGAAALLLVEESLAAELELEPLGFLSRWCFIGVDPHDQLLIGPALAVPRLLDAAGLGLDDMDLIDMHEAFAAQVLSVIGALESDEYARRHLGRDHRVGVIDMERFNVAGGSIAIGHPFAATGARQIMQALHELRHRSGRRVLCTACAAGGLAAALLLEAP